MSGEQNEKPSIPMPRPKRRPWMLGAVFTFAIAAALTVALFVKGFDRFGYTGVIFVAGAVLLCGIIAAFEDE